MFEIGDYVVCGNKGGCVGENIAALDISGVDKERQYYILKPKYQSGSTVYVPVDSPRDSMRHVLEKEEAQRLIAAIPEIPLLSITNEKLSEQTYRECLRTGSCEEWVRILKTICLRKEKRLKAGRKVTAVDAKYFRMAEDSLYGELAVALDMNRKELEEYIAGEVEGKVALS